MCAEKRRTPRIPLTVHVSYWVNEQERKGGYTVESVNVGAGGIFLKTDLPLGIGTEVRLEFTLPGNDDLLQMSGKVAWVGTIQEKGKGRVLGKGIKFKECDEKCRKILSNFMDDDAKKT